MIHYQRNILKNGLRVIIHQDEGTPMVAVNLCYFVGARDESPDHTGFAHLFEHLMFGGTEAAPDFDEPLQMAGGENNAFTNNDITNFYNVVPAENLEVALWLESDRMSHLAISEEVLSVQRKVVVEEFKETCLNEPFGDVWHHLSDLAYKTHPYRWPTIGKVPEHISKAKLSDVRAFYQKFYTPNNAVLVISGNVDPEHALEKVKKWFGEIPKSEPISRALPIEPPQLALQKKLLLSPTSGDALFMAFHIPSRVDADFYGVDLLSDILGNGHSSRLYARLLKERALFSSIDCYISGTIDPGLLIIEAKPSEHITWQTAKNAIWEELNLLKKEGIGGQELTKIQNKVESTLAFSELTVLNKAINLAFFEIIGNVSLINQEAAHYRKVEPKDISRLANQIFTEPNCTEVIYTRRPDVGSEVVKW